MKRIISITLCLVMLLTALIVPASAYSIKIVKMPDKTVFYEGLDWAYSGSDIIPKSDFDLTGTVIDYEGNDISFHKFPWGGNMIAEPANGKWQTGKNKVNIILDDFENVYVESELTLVAIKKAELAKSPDKVELIHGTDWDYDSLGYIALKTYSPAGAKVKLTYTDGTTTTVSYEDGGMDWMVSDEVEDFTLGTNPLTLTYYGHNIPFEVKFVLEEIKSATIKSKPTKQNYDFGSDWSYSNGKIVPNFDFSGLKVNLTYSNGTSETISYSTEPGRFKFNTPTTVSLGSNTVKATVDGKATVELNVLIRGYGDINFDGSVNSNDALNVLQYSVSLAKFSVVKYKYADVTIDDKVNSSDALAILQKAVGKIDYFKAELV
ncbi:MAG: dockerin type I repeat-containing protein [Clostridia bacterium]|nr:dockerin type I repeat-containing protein [Clostridia bacterium]